MVDWTIHQGDVADAPELIDEPVDAVLCDPPYGLGDPLHGDDLAEVLRAWLDGRGESAGGSGFMDRDWDQVRPPVEWEAIREVAKPGAFLASFGGTRTHDLQGVAQRLAGWSKRDAILAWVYGSGMPKGRDVGVSIDRRRDDESETRELCEWLRDQIDTSDLTYDEIAGKMGVTTSQVRTHWAAQPCHKQPQAPSLEQWRELKSLIGFPGEMDGLARWLNRRKGEPGESWKQREVVGTKKGRATRGQLYNDAAQFGDKPITAPATDEAARWDGYNTTLAPAQEPIGLWRNPTDQTYAECALDEGCGALNIDGCRVGFANLEDKEEAKPASYPEEHDGFEGKAFAIRDRSGMDPDEQQNDLGRWPANLVICHHPACGTDDCHEGCHVRRVGEQSGDRPVPSTYERSTNSENVVTYGSIDKPAGTVSENYGDSGTAARFFPRFRYQAKASRAEREAGLFDPLNGRTNQHVAIKPIELIEWLATLLLPPERESPRRVLVPYSGSGSEMIGAMLAGWDEVVGVEIDDEHCDVARQRVAWWGEHGHDAIEAHKTEVERREYEEETGQTSLLEATDG